MLKDSFRKMFECSMRNNKLCFKLGVAILICVILCLTCFLTEYNGISLKSREYNRQKTEKLIQINEGSNKNFGINKKYDFLQTTRNYEYLQDSYESSGDFMKEIKISNSNNIVPDLKLHRIEIIDNEHEKSNVVEEKHRQDLKSSETEAFFEREVDDYILQSLFEEMEESEKENFNKFTLSKSHNKELAFNENVTARNKDKGNISLKDNLEKYIGKLLLDYDSTETDTTNSLNQAKNQLAENPFSENTKQKREQSFSEESHSYFESSQASDESNEFFVTDEDNGDYIRVESDIQNPEFKDANLANFFNSFLKHMPSVLVSGSSQEYSPLPNYFSALPNLHLNGDVLKTEESNIQPQWKPNIIKDSNKLWSGLNLQNWFPKTDNVLHNFEKPVDVFSKIFHS